MLILTEGDSAKTLAVSGLGVIGRDHYGVFPLRGKLLNVRESNPKQVMYNQSYQIEKIYFHKQLCLYIIFIFPQFYFLTNFMRFYSLFFLDHGECRDQQHHQDCWLALP